MSLLLLLSAAGPAAFTLTCEGASLLLDEKNVNLKVDRSLTAKVFADEQLFSDDFTGASGVLGSNYTQQADVNIRLDGLGNANAVGAGRGLAWPNTVVFSNDQYAEITIVNIDTNNNSGVGLRVQTGVSPTVEQGYIFRTGNAGAAYTFAQYNTSSTNVNIITTSIIPQVGDRIRAVVVGGIQYFYVNNQLIAIGSSTSWSTGVPAIYGNGTVWKSDNFVAGNYGGLHLAGTYTTVTSSRVLSCSTASYILDLKPATLTKIAGSTLTADSSAVTLASSSINLKVTRTLSLAQTSITLAGIPVATKVGRSIPIIKATFSISTSDTQIKVGRRLVSSVQSYSFNGNSVNLLRGIKVPLTVQAFTLNGTSPNILFGRKVVASQQSYSLSGVPTGLLRGRSLPATKQTYTISTSVTNFPRTFRLSAAQQTYTLVGVPVALSKLGAAIIIAASSATNLATSAVSLRVSRTVALSARSYSFVGNNLNTLKGFKLTGDVRSYAVATSLTNLNRGRILPLSAASFTLGTSSILNILRGRKLFGAQQTYTLTGNTTNLLTYRKLGLSVYATILTRNPANLLAGRNLLAVKQTYALSGVITGLKTGRKLTSTTQSYNFTYNGMLFARGGFIKVWTGSAWTPKPLKIWNGTAWVSKPLKVWTGSIWRTY